MAHLFFCSRLCLKKIEYENEIDIEEEMRLNQSRSKKKNKKWIEEAEMISEEISSIYSNCSDNQRANVRVQFAKSTDLYKNLNDEKVSNDSFENEHQLDSKDSKIILKKVNDTPLSVSTNLTSFVSDSQSENKMKTPSVSNTHKMRDQKGKKLGKTELGIISEETKRYNPDNSDYLSDSSNRQMKINSNNAKNDLNRKDMSVSVYFNESTDNKLSNGNSKNFSSNVKSSKTNKINSINKRNGNIHEEKKNSTKSHYPANKGNKKENEKGYFRRRDSSISDLSINSQESWKKYEKYNNRSRKENRKKEQYEIYEKSQKHRKNYSPECSQCNHCAHYENDYGCSPSRNSRHGIFSYPPHNTINYPTQSTYIHPNANYINNNNIHPQMTQYLNPYENLWNNNINIPTNNNVYPNYQFTSNYNMINKQEANDGQYCLKCEEVYKQVLFNNLPLKICQCIFCNTMLNSTALEKVYIKYNKDLEDFYKKKLSETLGNSKEESISSNINLHFDINQNKLIQEQQSKNDYLFPRFDLKPSLDHSLFGFSKDNTPKHNESWAAWISTKQKEEERKNENELVRINTENSEKEETRIGEVFKKKKKDLIEKFNNRATSVKVKKTESREIRLTMTPKNKRNHKNSLSPEKNRKKFSQSLNDNEDLRQNEPNKEVLDRLINGERINLNKDEIKALNKRLTANLPDIHMKEREAIKKQELEKRIENGKIFNKKIREDNMKQIQDQNL